MGMANLYLAKGQIDEAMEVCMEIIRQGVALSPKPHSFKCNDITNESYYNTIFQVLSFISLANI